MSSQRSGPRRLAALTLVAGAVIAGVAINAAPAYAVGEPTVTSLSVIKGSTAGGTNVLITGTGFSTVTETGSKVMFGATASAVYLVMSSTQIAAKAPAGTEGVTDVIVTNGVGASAASTGSKFTYRTPLNASVPANTLLNPISGSSIVVGVGTYTLTSTTFAAEKITATVGGAAAVVSWYDTENVRLAVPAGVPSSTATTVALFHDTVAGTTNDSTNAKYAAVITSLSITKGPKGGTTGANLTITGKGLTGAGTWKFGAIAATCVVTNDTTATCADIPASHATTPVVGAVSVNFVPADSVPYGTTTGAAYTYTDVS